MEAATNILASDEGEEEQDDDNFTAYSARTYFPINNFSGWSSSNV